MLKHKRGKSRLVVFHTECIYTRGGEKYLYELLKRLAPSYAITLYVHKINAYWKRQYKNHGITVERFWTPPHLYWLLLPITVIVNVVTLRRKIPLDAVFFATNFPVNLLAVLLSKKTVCHCFEPLAIFYDPYRISSLPTFSRFCVRVARLLYASLDRYAIHKSTILTTLSSSVAPFIIQTYSRKPDAYIPNGVDTKFFIPKQKKNIIGYKKVFIMGHSTDYTVFKGTEQFLVALSYLTKRHKPFRVLISESIYDARIRQLYMNQIKQFGLACVVHFIGNLTEDELLRFYQSLDAFCYTGSPHSAGGSSASLSVLEAQSCGVPVLRSVGNEDEIVDGETGYYINPDNPRAVAFEFSRMMRLTEQKTTHMRRASRQHVLMKHSWETSARRLHYVLQGLYKT